MMLDQIKRFKGAEVELEYLLTGETNAETIMFVHGAGANLRQFIPPPGVNVFSSQYSADQITGSHKAQAKTAGATAVI